MSQSIVYRPDIDGLRAIAIISVVGFHAFPEMIPGGFVGVDIFFVISGFLISSIIIKNIKSDKFSYTEFYARRIRRIFPSLLLVITVTWLLGWFLLFPNEFQQLGRHILGGIGFVSNFVLWDEVGYFDNLSETKPLLHLWSLGIEEQFYLVWPFFLWLIWRYRVGFLYPIAFVVISSFIFNIYSLYSFSLEALFYSPLSRFWELAIGAGLACFSMEDDRSRKNFSNMFSFVGLSLILLAFFLAKKDSSYPGWLAVFPVVGTALLIFSRDSWFNKRLLSSRPFIYVGLISYSLYLWHWPLFSYLHITEKKEFEYVILAIIISFILAIATYELLEKRLKLYRNINRLAIYLVSLSLIMFFIGLATHLGNLSPRNNSLGVQMAAAASNDWDFPNDLDRIEVNKIGVYVKKSGDEKVLFFGDSHIQQYSPRIVKVIEENPLNTKTAILATRGNCPPIPNIYDDDNPRCDAVYRKAIIDYAFSDEVDSVVLGFAWGHLSKRKDHDFYYLKGEEKISLSTEEGFQYAHDSFESLVSSLAKYKKVYLIIDNPAGKGFDPSTFFSGDRISGVVDKRVVHQAYDIKQQEVRRNLSKLAERSGIIVIDSVKHFCDDNKCPVILDNGTPMYKDMGHIRSEYVKKHVKYLDDTILKD